MGFKFISVIVPAHNEQEYISQCLKSLVSQDYPKDRYEVIVVDNNSEDRTRDIAAAFSVKVIEQKHGPVGAVRNAGAKQAVGDAFAFIDADCIAPNDWISKGAGLLSRKNSVYGGGCELRANPHWIEKAWLLKSISPPKDLLGCCIFIEKSDFFEVGAFDEKVTSGEDTKLSTSLRAKSYSVVMTEVLNVIHLGNPTTLKSFFLRQAWHSENYLQNWRETLKDPTFYFLILFLSGILFLSPSATYQNKTSFFLSIIIIAATPFVFSLKRLRRSKHLYENLRNLPAIYFLDFIYLSGRMFGLYKSVRKTIKTFTARERSRVD